jgi:hypothetical protein
MTKHKPNIYLPDEAGTPNTEPIIIEVFLVLNVFCKPNMNYRQLIPTTGSINLVTNCHPVPWPTICDSNYLTLDDPEITECGTEAPNDEFSIHIHTHARTHTLTQASCIFLCL